MTARPCAYAPCGRAFHPTAPHQRYCCKSCWEAARRLVPKPCPDCGTETRGALRRCASCTRAERNRRQRVRRRVFRSDRPDRQPLAATLMSGDAGRRQRADRALQRGRADRRCVDCGRRYHLAHMDTPCPTCGDHLAEAAA